MFYVQKKRAVLHKNSSNTGTVYRHLATHPPAKPDGQGEPAPVLCTIRTPLLSRTDLSACYPLAAALECRRETLRTAYGVGLG